MKVFVPLNDDIPQNLEDSARLVPYRPGLPLCSQFEILDRHGKIISRGLITADPVRAGRRAARRAQPLSRR